VKPTSVTKPAQHRNVLTVTHGMACQDCEQLLKILFPKPNWFPSAENVRYGSYHAWRGWCGHCRINYWPEDSSINTTGPRDVLAENEAKTAVLGLTWAYPGGIPIERQEV
jgi:hypothetical protein